MNTPGPHRPRLLVVGPTPPPYNGMSVATQNVLELLERDFEIIHLDTADRRPLATVGRLDIRNILLAFRHALRFLLLAGSRRPEAVYVPIAQAPLGFLRDACFLVPARLLGLRTIVHLHGGHFARFHAGAPGPLRTLIRYSLGHATAAIDVRLRGHR